MYLLSWTSLCIIIIICCCEFKEKPQNLSSWHSEVSLIRSTLLPMNSANKLRLHYNAVLYNADSIMKMSPDDHKYTQSKLWNCTLCIFPSQVWHQLIFPEAVSTGHSVYNAYVIRYHVWLKVLARAKHDNYY